MDPYGSEGGLTLGMIGFIGLGVMGAKMAARLTSDGHQLLAYDLNREAVDTLVAKGAQGAQSIADVAQRANIIFCSLPTPAALETVLTGPDGISGGGCARVVIDLSTTGPTVTQVLSRKLAEQGITLIDAPVSGGAPGAEAGTLTLMVSGPRPVFDEIEHLFRVIGKNIFYVGAEAGLGQTMKLVNNLLFAANALSAFEVLTFGAKAGLDARTMIDVVNVSSGRSYVTTDRIPQTVLDRSFPNRFATSLLQKDVKLGVEAAQAFGSPLHMIHAVYSFLSFALSQGDGPRDCAELIKHYEAWAGVTVGDHPES